jgi:hypothetical protein
MRCCKARATSGTRAIRLSSKQPNSRVLNSSPSSARKSLCLNKCLWHPTLQCTCYVKAPSSRTNTNLIGTATKSTMCRWSRPPTSSHLTMNPKSRSLTNNYSVWILSWFALKMRRLLCTITRTRFTRPSSNSNHSKAASTSTTSSRKCIQNRGFTSKEWNHLTPTSLRVSAARCLRKARPKQVRSRRQLLPQSNYKNQTFTNKWWTYKHLNKHWP